MNDREKNILYERAVEKWGLSLQLGMLTEECAELIQAVNKYNRGKGIDNLVEEIADVEIMTEQINHVMYLKYMVQKVKEQKLQRLKKMLEEKEDG